MTLRSWYISLILALCVSVIISLYFGPSHIAFSDIFSGLFGKGDEDIIVIAQNIRLPRTLLALIVGAGLGASGAALQGYTRNPLAAPGLLGFSSCAALGAVLALYFGWSAMVTPAAILFALFGAVLMASFSRRKPGASGLILAGIGIGALATALTGLVMNFAPNPWALSELVYWLMGSLKHADMQDVLISGPLTALGLVCLILIGPALRVLGLGEDTARSLGVSIGTTQFLLVAGCALSIGAGVAVAGAIGFVGLFIPHILRFLTGPDEAHLIPLSALGGGVFLVLIDTLIRITSGPGTPLYLGIATSLIGVPFFLWLAWRQA